MAEARILVVDDEYLIRWTLQQNLEKEGYEVLLAETGEEGLNKVTEEAPDLVLLDIKLPGMDGYEVLERTLKIDQGVIPIMITAFEDVEKVVRAMRMGAFDYITKPFDFSKVRLSVQKALEASQLKREVRHLRRTQRSWYGFENVVAVSQGMKRVLQVAEKIARSDAATILIQGDGGTLFLDEIGDMHLNLQGKILRLVEQRTFRRIGGIKDIHVDVRIITATNKDLLKLKEEAKFREDLFYRVNVASIKIPPLRERPDDVLPLTKYFLQKYNEEFHKNVQKISKGVEDFLKGYDWPGNVRELKNVIERAMILDTL